MVIFNSYVKLPEGTSEKDWERPLTHTALKPDTHTHICSELSGIPSQSDMLCWLRLMSWTTIFVNTSVMIWSAIGDSRLWTRMSQDVTEKKKHIEWAVIQGQVTWFVFLQKDMVVSSLGFSYVHMPSYAHEWEIHRILVHDGGYWFR